MLNEGHQIPNFFSSSGSGTVINYGSGSASPKVKSYGSYGSGSTTLPTGAMPAAQHWPQGPLHLQHRPQVQGPWGGHSAALG